MDYIENIYVCLVAPVIITAFCVRGERRKMVLFLFGGMTSCLLSSYISTFIAGIYGADLLTASLEISPFVEELMKFLPVLFYMLVFEPEKRLLSDPALFVSVGFATFENVCFLTQNGAANILRLLIRGFGTGAMHVVCGVIIAFGLMYLWDRVWLRIAGTIALLVVAMSYHGIYNILVSQPGLPAIIGYFIPLATIFTVIVFTRTPE